MFRNYLAAALRNLLRNRVTAAVAVGGLAIGLAAALLIALYVRYERSYDTFFPGHERVFRVSMITSEQGQTPTIWDATYFNVAELLKTEFPQVELSARWVDEWLSVRRGAVEYHEPVLFADPEFFKIVPLRAVAGDPATALEAPDGLVMSRSMARKYFGRDDPLGETVELERGVMTLRVNAVIEDLPGNSHLNLRLIASGRAPASPTAVYEARAARVGYQLGAHTYFRLREGAAVDELVSRLPELVKRHFQMPREGSIQLVVHAVRDVHLAPAGRFRSKPPGNPQTLVSLSIIAALILFIAVINFVNLMTARSSERSVEVGIRKVAGAGRRDLIFQFIGESLLHVIIAMLLAMSIVEAVLPYFNALLHTGEEVVPLATIQFDYWRDPALAGVLVVFTLALGIIAGAYPAFVTSSFRPAAALKRARLRGGPVWVRHTLVIVQLATVIGLIFATATIHRQTTFAMNEGLKIDTDQVLLMHLHGPPSDAFLISLRQLPGVIGVTGAEVAPTNFGGSMGQFRSGDGPQTTLRLTPVDANFFEFFHLKPLAGRTFQREREADLFVMNDPNRHWSVVLNETAVRSLHLGSPQEAIGKSLHFAGWGPVSTQPASITVSGVVPDYPVDSMRSRVEPTLFGFNPDLVRILSIRLDGRRIPETLQAVDTLWRKLGEPRAISRWFLEQYYERLYADVLQQRKVLGLICAVAVLLACLGLFGLSVFTAQRRTKEIGIRKVMGASSADMMKLLLWAFTKPIFWASLAAWPVALWAMRGWLNGFIYRVELGFWMLPLASLGALTITLLTVSAHTFAVARSKPVNALRYE